MERNRIERWLQENLDNPRIRKEVKGTANDNFFVNADRNYILRVSRDISEERLENEFRTLNFLEDQGIENVPQAVKMGEIDGKKVLLQTEVGEKDIGTEELDASKLKLLAESVAEIHSIPVEEYNEFFGTDKQDKKSLKEVFKEDFREWSKKPYEEYRKSLGDHDRRLEKHFSRQKQKVEEIPDIKVSIGLTHGDLSSNIRIGNGEIFIVDWEFSRIGNPSIEILYFFQHQNLSEEQKNIFLKEYREYRDLGKGFKKCQEFYPQFLAFNDAAWAAKRYARSGKEKYRELLEERIEKLESY